MAHATQTSQTSPTPQTSLEEPHSMWRQPRTVWSVAFACVIAFMGIGLVDPILKPIADQLGAGPSQVSLLFTSYMAVMGVAMLITGWVSSRLGAKRTLALGLIIIIVGAGLAGMSTTVNQIVGWRAIWGLGNALFIATALATIVAAAKGPIGQVIILFESALGLGIAAGPLLGGALGSISWRWPFWGVSALMLIALAATIFTLPNTPPSGHRTSLAAPFAALKDRGLLTVAITALLYNFGFFSLLAFAPFPLNETAQVVGFLFFGWGLLLAISSVAVGPWLQAKIGAVRAMLGALTAFAAILVVMAIWTDSKVVLGGGIVIAGLVLGVVNTAMTQAVMNVKSIDSGVASSAYNFVRFGGGAVAPWLAGTLGERSIHLPFWVGAVAVLAGIAVLASGAKILGEEPAGPAHPVTEPTIDELEAEVVGAVS